MSLRAERSNPERGRQSAQRLDRRGRLRDLALTPSHHRRDSAAVLGRARLAEEVALADVEPVVEQLEQRLLVLDLLDDDRDAVRRERGLELLEGAQARLRVLAVQQLGVDLDEADVAPSQALGVTSALSRSTPNCCTARTRRRACAPSKSSSRRSRRTASRSSSRRSRTRRHCSSCSTTGSTSARPTSSASRARPSTAADARPVRP